MPDRLGRYVVQRRIGAGGFATVWLAYDDHLDSPVAVKVLADNWTADAHVRRRFVEEGRYLRRVESPHVVTVYDAGELDDERPYLVMTYADQGTLADRLAEGSDGAGTAPLAVAQSLEVIRQVAAGLQAMHERDVVHRDIKPANVLFRSEAGGRDVRAMVGDLGLGKALDVSSRLTMVAGTPSFVAPEQAAAESLDARADQYSLAAVAYLLLTGRPPFSHATLAAAAAPGPVPAMDVEGLAPEAEEVVRRGLAVRREDRYPSVVAFAAALAGTLDLDGTPVRLLLPGTSERTQPGTRPSRTAPPTEAAPAAEPEEAGEPAPRARRRRRAAALAAGLLLVGGAAGVGGYAVSRGVDTTATLVDDRDNLSVSVPDDWQREVSLAGWTPPNQLVDTPEDYAALSAGSAEDWNSVDAAGEGVFVGVLPGSALPDDMPGHPRCTAGMRSDSTDDHGQAMVTVPYTGCPHGVLVERVVQITTGHLMWVQVHADTLDEAYEVVETVQTHGL